MFSFCSSSSHVLSFSINSFLTIKIPWTMLSWARSWHNLQLYIYEIMIIQQIYPSYYDSAPLMWQSAAYYAYVPEVIYGVQHLFGGFPFFREQSPWPSFPATHEIRASIKLWLLFTAWEPLIWIITFFVHIAIMWQANSLMQLPHSTFLPLIWGNVNT